MRSGTNKRSSAGVRINEAPAKATRNSMRSRSAGEDTRSQSSSASSDTSSGERQASQRELTPEEEALAAEEAQQGQYDPADMPAGDTHKARR